MNDRYADLMLDIDVLCYSKGFRKISNLSVQDLKSGEVIDMFDNVVEIDEERDIPNVIKSKNLEIGALKYRHTIELRKLNKTIDRLNSKLNKYEQREYAEQLDAKLGHKKNNLWPLSH